MIERDIKDSAPTVNANFRVIGKFEQNYTNSTNSNFDDYELNNYNEYEEDYIKKPIKNINNNQRNKNIIDWNDNSFDNW